MIRSVLAVLGGIVAAGAVIAFGEAASHLLVPPPAGMNPSDHESIKAAMAHMSAWAFAGVLGSWTIGTFLGAGLAAVLSRHARMACALVVGCTVLAAAVLNMVTIPHPAWVWIAAFLLVVPSAWLAGRLARPAAVR